MRKLLVLLAVLAIAVPAMADVVLTCTVNGDWVTVSYNASTETELVRAFALDIEVGGGTIVAVENLNAKYDIHPGSFEYDADEETYAGNLVCDATFPGTLGGIGTAGVTTEQGSLYVGEANAPTASGQLLKFQVACGSAEDVVVTVTENAARGGVVLEDPAIAPTVVSNGTIVCEGSGCDGDFNGDNKVNINDITGMISYWKTNKNPLNNVVNTNPNWNPVYDLNSDLKCNVNDITALIAYWKANKNPLNNVVCPGPGM